MDGTESTLGATGIAPTAPQKTEGKVPTGGIVVTSATVISGKSITIVETFIPITYAQNTTLQSEATKVTSVSGQSSSTIFVIGAGGVAWSPYQQPTDSPDLPPPTAPPTDGVKPTGVQTGLTKGTDGGQTGNTGGQTAKTNGQTVKPTLSLITKSYDPQASTVSSVTPKPTGNTAISTGDGSHPSGRYPLIHGGPDCLFCPPGLGGGGIILWGMIAPGVRPNDLLSSELPTHFTLQIYPPRATPPFPGVQNFPTITIASDLVPTPSASQTSPKTEKTSKTDQKSCTKTKTVSDCSVICSATDVAKAPTTGKAAGTPSCSTSCYSTIVGCSPTGTTVTTTKSEACALLTGFTSVGTGDAPILSGYLTYTPETAATGKTAATVATGKTAATVSAGKTAATVSAGKTAATVAIGKTAATVTTGKTAGTVATGKTAATVATVKTAATKIPALPTTAAPTEVDGKAYPSCASNTPDKKATDIFNCNGNNKLFKIFAPVGTPNSSGPAKNDEAGWGSWKGGGRWCSEGVFC